MKICSSCGENKPLIDYYMSKQQNKTGVAYYPKSICKVCFRKRSLNHSKKSETKRKRKLNESKPEVKKRLKQRTDAHNRMYVKSGKSAEWKRKQRKNNIAYRIKCNLRCRLWCALKGKDKSAKTMELTGCTGEHAVEWIESQFNDQMSWDIIEVDHIIPCSSFNLIDPEEQKKCFHFTNLQPLLKEDNRRKSDHILDDMVWSGSQWLKRGKNNLYRPRNLRIEVYK